MKVCILGEKCPFLLRHTGFQNMQEPAASEEHFRDLWDQELHLVGTKQPFLFLFHLPNMWHACSQTFSLCPIEIHIRAVWGCQTQVGTDEDYCIFSGAIPALKAVGPNKTGKKGERANLAVHCGHSIAILGSAMWLQHHSLASVLCSDILGSGLAFYLYVLLLLETQSWGFTSRHSLALPSMLMLSDKFMRIPCFYQHSSPGRGTFGNN